MVVNVRLAAIYGDFQKDLRKKIGQNTVITVNTLAKINSKKYASVCISDMAMNTSVLHINPLARYMIWCHHIIDIEEDIILLILFSVYV